MTTEREALDRIAALCDWWDDGETEYELVPIHRVRAILAEVTPEPGGVLDRDALWTIYDRYSMPNDVQEERGLSFDAFVQEVEAAVRPAAIDRDALRDVLATYLYVDSGGALMRHVLDRIEATCVRPRGGVVLSPEETARIDHAIVRGGWTDDPEDQALAARLEAAS